MSLAKADGSYAKLMASLAKADVLILDDLGLGTLREVLRHDLLGVLEDRYGDRSTIVTSQLPTSGWHDWVSDPTLADAILDRFVHNAYKIELSGASGRREHVRSFCGHTPHLRHALPDAWWSHGSTPGGMGLRLDVHRRETTFSTEQRWMQA